MIRLGPFDLHEPVGKGGMGEIWAATHRGQRVPAAVKVLTVSRAQDFGFRAAFRKEVRAVAGLDHPNIVFVFDHGEVPDEAAQGSDGRLVAGSPYLAMELVPGGSLADQRGELEWPTLRSLLLDLLAALAHAHSRGVIHRDIKPGNVLVRMDGTAKLTDFGLAHAIAGRDVDEIDPARRGGTPAYMAPEQLQGAWRDFGPWTDLYAVGCLGWSMATGRPPFAGSNWVEVMRAHLADAPGRFRPRQPVPPELEEWLRKLLAKHPTHRFRRAADAAWALLSLPESAPGPPPPPEPAGSPQDHTTGAPPAHRTTLFWSDHEVITTSVPLREAVPPEPGARPTFEAPPIPRDWRRLELGRSRLLLGAGLGLFGLRTIALVGRDAERDALWEQVRDLRREARVQVAWIHGPVGCGKSRLAGWLCERAHEVGAATVLRAIHGAVPGPTSGLARMVAHHLGATGMAPDAAQERVRDLMVGDGVDDEYEWRALVDLVAPGGRDRSVKLASPRERYLLIARMLARLGQERPVILWLDDVQWGSDAIGLAEHLVQHEPELPVLVLATARDDHKYHAAAARLRKLASGPRGRDLPLGRLEPLHASALVRDLLGLRGELADQVEKRAAGNPLFMVQLVGDWVRRGLLEPTERGFQLKRGARVHLPDDLHEVWSDALAPVLERAPAGGRVTLELAAALGQRLDGGEWSALCRVAGAPGPTTVSDLCVSAGLMRPTEVGWEFVHAMLRESLERTAREKGRWSRHNLACADMLADRYPDQPEALAGRLGRHLLVAGHAEPALDLLLRGVRVHTEASEYREALELLDRRDRALEELGTPADDPRRVEGWLWRARVYLQQGRPHLAEAWAERGERATRGTGLPVLHAHALARLADVFHLRGEVDAAERHYLAALQRLRVAKDWAGTGDCLHGLGQLADRRGRYDRARELLEEARAAYAAVNAPLQLAQCIDGLARVHRRMGNLTTAHRLAEEALARYEGLGNTSGIATALHRLAVLDLIAGDHAEGQERLIRALRLYERIGDPLGQLNCYNGLAESARFQGDLEAAEIGYRRAMEIGETIGTGERLIPLLNLALVVLRTNRFAEARTLLEDAAEKLEEDGRRALLGGTHIGLMACAAADGDLSAFELHFHLGRRLQEESGMIDPDCAWPAELAGDLLWDRGEHAWARACWELALLQWSGLGRAADVARIKEHLTREPG